MPRYPHRPWYSPLGFMASAPHSYSLVVFTLGFYIAYPFRYQLSEYYERQQATPGAEMRTKAVMYYRELERMHRRQAMLQHQLGMQGEFDTHQSTARGLAQNFAIGDRGSEYDYWNAHQRDAIRAEKLLHEIKELQVKLQSNKV